MSDIILEMRNITKEFPGVKALSDVNLSVRRGDIHAICGENGAGKSTLMKVLSGVYPHGTYDGQIFFDDEEVKFNSINQSEAKGIVIIHQELALVPQLSIAENIFLGNEQAESGRINWHKTNQRAAQLLRQVGLDENPTTLIQDIGVGKQQLVEISKALSKKVKLLILDEPTAALNDTDSAHLLGLLRQLRDEGITSIMISHKLNEIISIADANTIIRDGMTIETIQKGPEMQQSRIIKGMVGRDLEHLYPDHEPKIGEELFRIEDWSVMHPTIPGRKTIDDASLNVRAGEIVGIAGLMGAGRTELAMSVFGEAWGHKISGKAYLHGKEADLSSVHQAINAGLAYATEDRKRFGLNLIDDIRRNISAASLDRLKTPLGSVNANEEIKRAEQFRGSMRIKAPSVMTIAGQLSGGNQQKVVLSKWMMTEPEVLILDEPTRGIDVGAKYEIYTIINSLADAGKAVIVISSELPELLGICDRIYTLAFGRITGVLDRGEANQENLMTLMTKEREAA
ncbi:multiple monosaccharide ABC transporter ATP-binding protein [Tessaracoccus sp. MC1756]|uniref:multiple monosaccharide ABC transporter ATP-binding protein n=1 Tax=Tessaracoccus sp. MC1756 TaxID=2760311 RepID=UPI001602982B|nr:multiple monosaccharide ABC transporter ATP-binding protein [Tessaracoccus sp. MC1756]MBB1508713.1 ATP-binding cassette domain-containing protein [Tessaracoccus sp. MC1756]